MDVADIAFQAELRISPSRMKNPSESFAGTEGGLSPGGGFGAMGYRIGSPPAARGFY